VRRVREAALVPHRDRLARARDTSAGELTDAVALAAAELRAAVSARPFPARMWRGIRVRRWRAKAARRLAAGDPHAVFDVVMVTRAGFDAAADYIERVAQRRADAVSAMIAVERGYLSECVRLRQAADRELAPLVHLRMVRRSA
jgi:hypothetical protein